jgi:O-antigen/teichoic acid export membrane protein
MVVPSAGALALLAYPVVIGWTGQEFHTAAPVLQVLAVVVIMRVGAWTSGTVLQGGGYHRLLGVTNIASAVTNVVLSVILVRTHGLLGVAFATLVPLSIRATTILAPMACRRVGMSVAAFVSHAVWPALWPAAVVLGALAVMRDRASVSLVGAVAQGAVCGLVYVMLFVGVAIGRQDRARYLGKLRSIAGRPALEAA